MDVILFGISRDLVGEKRLKIAPEENVQTVGALKQWMRQKYPQLETLTSMAIAVDSEYAEDEQTLFDTNEVAIIPPVSGG